MNRPLRHVGLLTLAAALVAGCASEEEIAPTAEGAPEAEGSTFDGEKADTFDAPIARDEIGEVFLVEHFTAIDNGTMRRAVANTPPGGIVFWNGNSSQRVGAVEVRETIRTYSEVAKDNGRRPLLFSTDYEGGGHRYIDQGGRTRSISGIQRFTTGFTKLAHPRWIGLAFDKDPELGKELAWLHGALISEELASVGMNYPLSVVADKAEGLFRNRGLHTDADINAEMMKSLYDGIEASSGVIFVTKHFPGLGGTQGDTHDQTVISTASREDLEENLLPFRTVVDHAQSLETHRLSIMCGHAKYTALDAERITTVSPTILQDLLRDEVGFTGLALSDAMWMGEYGNLSGQALMHVYLESFLAGMDMLMIPGYRFSKSLSYFGKVYDLAYTGMEAAAFEATVSELGLKSLAERMGTDVDGLLAQFRGRLATSHARLEEARDAVGFAHESMDAEGVKPADITTDRRARYNEILLETNARWADYL